MPTFHIGADENGLGSRLGPMIVTAVLAETDEAGERFLSRKLPKRMREDLDQERRATERQWAKRAKQIEAVTFNVAVRGPVTPAAVPEKSTLAEPSCAVDPTVTVTLCGAPGVSVNVAGVTLTPGEG